MSFPSDAERVIAVLDEYYRESLSGDKPVINQVPLEKLVKDLDLVTPVANGGLSGEGLRRFVEKYLAATTRLHHPAYMAHQVAAPHYAGALGALIDGFTNNAMAIYEMGPGAATIEHFVLGWFLEKVGWTQAPIKSKGHGDRVFGGGVLTHGGSLANLTALLAARSNACPEVWENGNPGNLALLAPEECHYSIARAAGILGIGHRSIYQLEVDHRGVVIPDRLPRAFNRLRDDGKQAIALVANACSTAVGLYDPLDEIGRFCAAHKIWFHVDGAHGAGALLSDKHRSRMKGIEQADSVVWDAHKLLRTPTLCAAVLVKDFRTLDHAFQQEASYLFHEKEQPGIDLIHRTVECTKAGLGLKFYLVLAALGERGLRAYIDRQFQLAMDAWEFIRKQPEFECPVTPQSNILCFRMKGSDQLQLDIRENLTAQGRFYLSTTSFRDKRYLRAAFMNPNTTMEDVERLINRIKKLGKEI